MTFLVLLGNVGSFLAGRRADLVFQREDRGPCYRRQCTCRQASCEGGRDFASSTEVDGAPRGGGNRRDAPDPRLAVNQGTGWEWFLAKKGG